MQHAQRETRSIGEVLALLKQEFEDITISKIRFLEGQGLINPERTSSGYRKFNDADLDQLRFILRAQKEQFLPLKVIKARLRERAEAQAAAEKAATKTTVVGGSSAGFVSNPLGLDATFTAGAMLSRSELLEASGLSESQLRELESYGLVQTHKTSGGVSYQEEAVNVARLAARFLQYGVEPRHLRIFKTGADREADLYRQLAGPVLGSRNTQARMDALARLEELHNLGEALRSQLLRDALNG